MNDIKLYRGNSSNWISAKITDPENNDEGVNLSGYIVRVYAKRNKNDPFADSVLIINSDDHAGQFNLDGITNGIAWFYFKPVNGDIEPFHYPYYLEFSNAAVDKVYTFPHPEDNAKLKIYPS